MPAAAPTHPLPAAVREKLGKLVPLLSSDQDGERVGAVAAIERVLKSAGLDWHDFTGWITAPPAAAPPPPPPRQPRPADPEDELGMSVLDHELVSLVEALRASRRFTARSEEFLDSLLERAGRFDVVHLSPKQKRWLEDLALKAKGASA
jgi:hypothetical protein